MSTQAKLLIRKWTQLYVILLCILHISCVTGIPKLLLISFDGFRYNYLDKLPPSETPNFHRMIYNGVKAKWMESVFPTVTYPNHFTLITGLYPESHGIVHNRFYDKRWNQHFWYNDLRDNFDPFWYDSGAEPIYVTNHLAGGGRKSGSLLWPTGVGKVKCVGPDYIIPYSDAFTQMNFTKRVDQMIDWFARKEDPINLGLLYFNEPDEYGHQFGPDSEEIKGMIKELDGVLGYLFKRLEDMKLNDSVNIILTADHGFAEVKEFRKLDDFLNPDTYTTGSDFKNTITVHIFPNKSEQQQTIAANLTRMQNVTVYQKDIDSKLKELHYNDNERIAPIILTGDEGIVIVKNQEQVDNFKNKGMHGYLPEIPDMHPIFLAMGPAFKKGHHVDGFKNVDVYPLMCQILGIPPAPNNGSLDGVMGMLKENDVEEKTFTLTAVSFLLLVGTTVMIAGIFAICACRNASNKTRFLTPWKKRIRTETGFKFLSTTENGLLSMNDDDDDEF